MSLSKDGDLAVQRRTERTSLSLSANVSFTIPLGHLPLVVDSSVTCTKSPTWKFHFGFSHFWRSWRVGTYSFSHRDQNWSARRLAFLYALRYPSALRNLPSSIDESATPHSKWLGVKASKFCRSDDTGVRGLPFYILSTSVKNVINVSSVMLTESWWWRLRLKHQEFPNSPKMACCRGGGKSPIYSSSRRIWLKNRLIPLTNRFTKFSTSSNEIWTIVTPHFFGCASSVDKACESQQKGVNLQRERTFQVNCSRSQAGEQANVTFGFSAPYLGQIGPGEFHPTGGKWWSIGRYPGWGKGCHKLLTVRGPTSPTSLTIVNYFSNCGMPFNDPIFFSNLCQRIKGARVTLSSVRTADNQRRDVVSARQYCGMSTTFR